MMPGETLELVGRRLDMIAFLILPLLSCRRSSRLEIFAALPVPGSLIGQRFGRLPTGHRPQYLTGDRHLER